PSPVEVPYVPETEYPEYFLPSDTEAPLEDQPLPIDASPTTLSPGYMADSDPEEDPEEDHVNYLADGGDDDDEPSDNDDDDTDDEEPFKDKDDDEEEAWKTIRLDPPMSPSMEARIAEYVAAPALPSSPPSPLSPWSPPLSQIPLPPLPPPPSSLHLPPPILASLPLPSSPLPPSLFIPPVDRREDIPKDELPPLKRLCSIAPTSRYEVGESSNAAPRLTGGHRVDYGFIGTLDTETRRQRAEAVSYGIKDT
ncbi:hypothetical protein Tco_1566747, partial [Tanacetum coccineum]